ncbi:MAG: hypothetical protein Q8922_12480 [Bacteroidota bacterium]|nr:hypothetical protein [Bacteroidota bacterium]MDP4232213.1 hypothetical protein [Bacteroidota bacterium]MDP4243606.1 hypothetical protein [Bacteroidota bacterium]MDP4288741.1 hypothetical protein [Bacteroidota bacterium]
MDFGYILQIGLFALLAVAALVIVVAAARVIPRSHKIKSYRYSKSGDDWILKYPGKAPGKA